VLILFDAASDRFQFLPGEAGLGASAAPVAMQPRSLDRGLMKFVKFGFNEVK
jgi:hypothetical protein